MTGWSRWAVLGVVVGVVACGQKPDAKTPAGDSGAGKGSEPKASMKAPPTEEPARTAAPARMPTAEPIGKSNKTVATDDMTDISPGQCDDLEAIVGKLTFNDLSAKIAPGLEQSKREKSEKDASEMAKKIGAQFGDSCRANMAGKSIRRDTLNCMFKAKDIATFEGCNR